MCCWGVIFSYHPGTSSGVELALEESISRREILLRITPCRVLNLLPVRAFVRVNQVGAWCAFHYMGAHVLALFGITSLLMWGLPLGVLYAFNNQLFPGSEALSPQSTTLWSGLLAVVSVNVVIALYIILALREKPVRAAPQPDPAFLSKARASVAQDQGNNPSQSSGSVKKTD